MFVSLSKMAGKTDPFSGKINWKWTSSQISRKFSYWENLLLLWMMLNKASGHLCNLCNNIYTREKSPTNIYLFIVNNSNTRKNCEIWALSNSAPTPYPPPLTQNIHGVKTRPSKAKVLIWKFSPSPTLSYTITKKPKKSFATHKSLKVLFNRVLFRVLIDSVVFRFLSD